MSVKLLGAATTFFLLACWALLIVSFALPWYEIYDKQTGVTLLYKKGGVEAHKNGDKMWVAFEDYMILTKRTMSCIVVFAVLAWIFVTFAIGMVGIKTFGLFSNANFISPLLIVDLGLAFTCNILSYLILVGLQSAQLTDCMTHVLAVGEDVDNQLAQCALDFPQNFDTFYFENNLWNNKPYTSYYTSLVSSFILIFATICAYRLIKATK